jgi:hypothetical protein
MIDHENFDVTESKPAHYEIKKSAEIGYKDPVPRSLGRIIRYSVEDYRIFSRGLQGFSERIPVRYRRYV